MSKPKEKKLPLGRRWASFLVYVVYRAVESLARALPLPACYRLGAVLGCLTAFFAPGYLRLVRRNLTIAFGNTHSEKEIRALAWRHFRRLGGNLFCGLKMPHLSAETLSRHVEWQGLDAPRRCVAEGRGVVFAILHMGSWELLSQAKEIACGGKPAAMFQPLGNPFLNAYVKRLRQRTGCLLIDRNEGFFAPTKHLREGGAIGVLVDQHAGDAGVWCPFFGRLASTTNIIHLLAQRSRASIFPLSVVTVRPGYWRAVALPEAALPGDPDAAAAELNLLLESCVRESPEDWFWVHNRWKTPNPAFLLQSYKRGVRLPAAMSTADLKSFEILIRSTNWLGDACMAIPAVRAIRRGRPDARVTILTPEKLADLWKKVAEVDAVIAIPKDAGVWKVRQLIKKSGRAYDVAVLLPNSLRVALEVWRLAPRIVGYRGHSRKWLINQMIPPPKQAGPVKHHSEHYLRLAVRVGADVRDATIYAPIEAVAAPEGPLRLALVPGAEYGPAKRWPVERFAETAREVAAQTPCQWVILGAAGDVPIAAELEKLLDGKCVNLVGKTSLSQLCDELRRCHLLLTNDTGAMHLAASLGVPTVSIFGSTDPNWTGPLGDQHIVLHRHVECSPCFLRKCPLDFRCMKEIEPAHATAAVLTALGQPAGVA